MTETHPHNGQNPTPNRAATAGLLIALYAAATMTPDQTEHLLVLLGIPTAFAALAAALKGA